MTTTAFTHIVNVALPTKLINTAIKVFDKVSGEKKIIKISSKGGVLTLSAKADSDYISYDIQVDNQIDFEFAVNYSSFANYAKVAESMLIHFGNKNVTIDGNVLEFVSVIDTHKEHNYQCSVTFDSDILTAIKKVGGCAKKDKSIYGILNNVYVKAFSNTHAEVVATDGYSLGKVKLSSKDVDGFTGYKEFLLARNVVSFLDNFSKGSYEVTLRGFNGKISVIAENFESGKFVYETDYIDGVYPDYNRIIENSFGKEEKMILCRKTLKAQLKEHIEFHSKNKVGKIPCANFFFNNNGDIEIISSIHAGDMKTAIYNMNSGKSVDKRCFRVNLKFLKNIIDNLDGSAVTVEFDNFFSAITFNHHNDEEFFLLMPAREVL